VVCFLLVSSVAYSSTLKIEAALSSEKLMNMYFTIMHSTSEDSSLHIYLLLFPAMYLNFVPFQISYLHVVVLNLNILLKYFR
jgi:hypothetical protein